MTLCKRRPADPPTRFRLAAFAYDDAIMRKMR
jgi:hypothetical protein